MRRGVAVSFSVSVSASGGVLARLGRGFARSQYILAPFLHRVDPPLAQIDVRRAENVRAAPALDFEGERPTLWIRLGRHVSRLGRVRVHDMVRVERGGRAAEPDASARAGLEDEPPRVPRAPARALLQKAVHQSLAVLKPEERSRHAGLRSATVAADTAAAGKRVCARSHHREPRLPERLHRLVRHRERPRSVAVIPVLIHVHVLVIFIVEVSAHAGVLRRCGARRRPLLVVVVTVAEGCVSGVEERHTRTVAVRSRSQPRLRRRNHGTAQNNHPRPHRAGNHVEDVSRDENRSLARGDLAVA
mmetsp:Transcript_25612/g.84320  ORF Transcript_25612/g.84320 Transcript_25612/m.84320 type:complete len:303 (+) Transcript_25612:3086-3994(+)